MDELRKSKIKFESGKLNVGDFAWVFFFFEFNIHIFLFVLILKIARPKSGSNSMDLVLDYIVERKRMDDFCSSIIDGRYKEQKVIIYSINFQIYLNDYPRLNFCILKV
jgi:crossover junction endonuclease MUS81